MTASCVQNSVDLARLAALSGDNADARAQLAIGETRFQAQYDKLPAAPFDRLQARIRWLNLESLVFYARFAIGRNWNRMTAQRTLAAHWRWIEPAAGRQ